MTIVYLWKTIREKHSSCQKQLHLKAFSGTFVAIDGEAFIAPYRVKSRERVVQTTDFLRGDVDGNEVDKIWKVSILRGLLRILEAGITPVLVFDGKKPEEKRELCQERMDKIENAMSRAQELKNQFRDLTQAQLLSISENDSRLVELRKVESALYDMPPQTKKDLKNFLFDLGFCVITCSDGIEAEKLVAAFTRDGFSAGLSPDGDSLANGANLLIRDSGYDNRKGGKVEVVHLGTLLDSMNLTFRQFQEVCVLSGCDYNNGHHIKNFGITKMTNLMIKWESFRNFDNSFLETHKETIELIKFDACMKLFKKIRSENGFDWKTLEERMGIEGTDVPSDEIFRIRYDFDRLRSVLEEHSLSELEGKLSMAFLKLPEPRMIKRMAQYKIFRDDMEEEKELEVLYIQPTSGFMKIGCDLSAIRPVS